MDYFPELVALIELCAKTERGASVESLLRGKQKYSKEVHPALALSNIGAIYSIPQAFLDDSLNFYWDAGARDVSRDLATCLRSSSQRGKTRGQSGRAQLGAFEHPFRSSSMQDDYRFMYASAIPTSLALPSNASKTAIGSKACIQAARTGIHTDVLQSHSWSANLWGCKAWLLVPPAEAKRHLYPKQSRRPSRLPEPRVAPHEDSLPPEDADPINDITEVWATDAAVALELLQHVTRAAMHGQTRGPRSARPDALDGAAMPRDTGSASSKHAYRGESSLTHPSVATSDSEGAEVPVPPASSLPGGLAASTRLGKSSVPQAMELPDGGLVIPLEPGGCHPISAFSQSQPSGARSGDPSSLDGAEPRHSAGRSRDSSSAEGSLTSTLAERLVQSLELPFLLLPPGGDAGEESGAYDDHERSVGPEQPLLSRAVAAVRRQWCLQELASSVKPPNGCTLKSTFKLQAPGTDSVGSTCWPLPRVARMGRSEARDDGTELHGSADGRCSMSSATSYHRVVPGILCTKHTDDGSAAESIRFGREGSASSAAGTEGAAGPGRVSSEETCSRIWVLQPPGWHMFVPGGWHHQVLNLTPCPESLRVPCHHDHCERDGGKAAAEETGETSGGPVADGTPIDRAQLCQINLGVSKFKQGCGRAVDPASPSAWGRPALPYAATAEVPNQCFRGDKPAGSPATREDSPPADSIKDHLKAPGSVTPGAIPATGALRLRLRRHLVLSVNHNWLSSGALGPALSLVLREVATARRNIDEFKQSPAEVLGLHGGATLTASLASAAVAGSKAGRDAPSGAQLGVPSSATTMCAAMCRLAAQLSPLSSASADKPGLGGPGALGFDLEFEWQCQRIARGSCGMDECDFARMLVLRGLWAKEQLRRMDRMEAVSGEEKPRDLLPNSKVSVDTTAGLVSTVHKGVPKNTLRQMRDQICSQLRRLRSCSRLVQWAEAFQQTTTWHRAGHQQSTAQAAQVGGKQESLQEAKPMFKVDSPRFDCRMVLPFVWWPLDAIEQLLDQPSQTDGAEAGVT